MHAVFIFKYVSLKGTVFPTAARHQTIVATIISSCECIGGLGPSLPLYLIEGAPVSNSSEICISVIAIILSYFLGFREHLHYLLGFRKHLLNLLGFREHLHIFALFPYE